MQLNFTKIISYLIWLNLIVLMVVPQLNNVHYDPLPQFWAEITFAWASLSLFLLVCFTFKSVSIPRIIIPLLLFALWLCLQQYVTPIEFIGLSYVSASEFFICILLAISVNTLITYYGLKTFLTYLSLALVIGGILQSGIGFIQYNGWFKYFGSLIFYDSSHPTTNIFGHFGQRNHYCHYLSWVVFALIYLLHQRKINSLVFYLLTAWLMFSMTIAGSRSVFIYFIVANVITLLYYLKVKTSQARRLFSLTLITSLILFLFEYLYPLVHLFLTQNHQISSGLERLVNQQDGSLAGRRLIEWQKAWLIFKQHPVFGLGWNEFAHQSVYLQPLFLHVPMNDGLFTNCHNLILQLLAETGLIGTLLAVGGIVYTIYSILKSATLESMVILCMLGTTLTHSMLEYPLWYLYFLGPCIMFLAIDSPLTKISSNIMAGIVTLPLALLVYLMLSSSFIFNSLVNYVDTPTDLPTFSTQAKYLENLAKTNVLWEYSALYTLDNYITINDPLTNKTFSPQAQLYYENKFSNFHPYPDNMIKQAMLEWNLGNQDAAESMVHLALIAFPAYQASYLNSLKDKKYHKLYIIAKNYTYQK